MRSPASMAVLPIRLTDSPEAVPSEQESFTLHLESKSLLPILSEGVLA